jgi:hypothetical protein
MQDESSNETINADDVPARAVSVDGSVGAGVSATSVPAADIAARAGLRQEGFDPYRDLAETRRSIAAWLITILAAAILLLAVLPLVYVLGKGHGDAETVKDLLLIVFSPLVTLVTAVTAFYFGERSAGGRD